MSRVYLDHNATTPLRAEARAAMHAAMDMAGNPSSVHAEGRAAKALVERARAQVARLVGAEPAQVVFTGSATEAAAQVLRAPWPRIASTAVEHDCIARHRDGSWANISVDAGGVVDPAAVAPAGAGGLAVVQAANSETGVCQPIPEILAAATALGASCLIDAVQHAGKLPLALDALPPSGFFLLSAHKLGGPKGVGALVVPPGADLPPLIPGGGQESGRRSGTENVIGIAGFGAAAEAADADIRAARWNRTAELRNILENALEGLSNKTIFVGKDSPRLPNTSCFAYPGWKGETQVMQLDLAGFAISAGSACSSGKVRASGVLAAMGFDEATARAAIRVSLGLETTESDVLRFAEAWAGALRKHEARAA